MLIFNAGAFCIFVFLFFSVGAGSAGCVVANRLSEHFNVLLLERGGEPNPVSLIPGLATILLNRPQTDYVSEP
jgi:choline dehydrogenase-like flavoprotein